MQVKNEWEKDHFQKSYNLHNLNTFEEVIEETFGDMLIKTHLILYLHVSLGQNIKIKFKL
jgi:hypothetical protein